MEEFVEALENALPAQPSVNSSERWSHLRDTIYNTVMSTFGKRQVKSADWFEANAEELLPPHQGKTASLLSIQYPAIREELAGPLHRL